MLVRSVAFLYGRVVDLPFGCMMCSLTSLFFLSSVSIASLAGHGVLVCSRCSVRWDI
jgi:hypothetical protein